MTAGSAPGGALAAAFGVTVAFAVNAASFAADIAVLRATRIGPSPRIARAPRQLRDGLRYAWHTPTLRSPLLALGIIATLAFRNQVSIPILLRSSLDGGASRLGAALTVDATG